MNADTSSHKGKHHFLILVVSALALSLIIVSAMLWREWSRRFPTIKPGIYTGYITNIHGTAKQQRTWLYAEKTDEKLVVAVLAPGWLPQEIKELPAPVGDALLPITLEGPTEQILLMGSSNLDVGYAGSSQSGENDGKWALQPSTVAPQEKALKEIRLALLLLAELQDIETKIREAELRVPQQRAEIDKLTIFITEGERLKARANERFALAKDELEKAQKELVVRQEEAKKLQDTLEITQKLSGMGKLVALSRESIEREARWIESMARSGGGSPADLEAAVERGQKILALKKDIKEEQERIERLTSGGTLSDAPESISEVEAPQ